MRIRQALSKTALPQTMYAALFISLSFIITLILQQLFFLSMRRRLLIALSDIFYGQHYAAWALVIVLLLWFKFFIQIPLLWYWRGTSVLNSSINLVAPARAALFLLCYFPHFWNMWPRLSDNQSAMNLSTCITPSTLFLYMPMIYCFLFRMFLSLFPIC